MPYNLKKERMSKRQVELFFMKQDEIFLEQSLLEEKRIKQKKMLDDRNAMLKVQSKIDDTI